MAFAVPAPPETCTFEIVRMDENDVETEDGCAVYSGWQFADETLDGRALIADSWGEKAVRKNRPAIRVNLPRRSKSFSGSSLKERCLRVVHATEYAYSSLEDCPGQDGKSKFRKGKISSIGKAAAAGAWSDHASGESSLVAQQKAERLSPGHILHRASLIMRGNSLTHRDTASWCNHASGKAILLAEPKAERFNAGHILRRASLRVNSLRHQDRGFKELSNCEQEEGKLRCSVSLHHHKECKRSNKEVTRSHSCSGEGPVTAVAKTEQLSTDMAQNLGFMDIVRRASFQFSSLRRKDSDELHTSLVEDYA